MRVTVTDSGATDTRLRCPSGSPLYTARVNVDDPEIEYLRAVEDLFATLRGVPHLLSPKDVHLVRTWWKDGVSLAAVTAGVTEVMERRRETGDDDPVVSLSYCRHAVRRHHKRHLEAHLGEEMTNRAGDSGDELRTLADDLRASARTTEYLEAADVIVAFADRVAALGGTAPALVDEQLFALESALLEACRKRLPTEIIGAIETEADRAVSRIDADSENRVRTRRAVLDRAVRRILGLPRLELG